MKKQLYLYLFILKVIINIPLEKNIVKQSKTIEESETGLDIKKKKKIFKCKSDNNVDYDAEISVSSFQLKINIDEFGISEFSYKEEYSYSDLVLLSNYFLIFNSIDEAYEDLIKHFENECLIINKIEYIDMITPIQNSIIKNITFSNIKKFQKSSKEKIKELYDLVNKLEIQNNESEKKINDCLNENSKLKKEIKDLKNSNVLLISESTDLLYNLLKICPYINQISILSPNFIVPRLNEQFLNKFKIIIYDLQDGGFQIADDIHEIKKYLNNGGNIILTHDQWLCRYYKGESYKLFKVYIENKGIYKNVKKAKIVKSDHPIFKSFYQLNIYDIDISETHKTDNIYFDDEYLEDMIIELEDDLHGEYLMVKNYGKGKIIYWNVGHIKSLTSYEEKLFINIISWIYQNE